MRIIFFYPNYKQTIFGYDQIRSSIVISFFLNRTMKRFVKQIHQISTKLQSKLIIYSQGQQKKRKAQYKLDFQQSIFLIRQPYQGSFNEYLQAMWLIRMLVVLLINQIDCKALYNFRNIGLACFHFFVSYFIGS